VFRVMSLWLNVQAATVLFLIVQFSIFQEQPELAVPVMMVIDGKITNVKATIVKRVTVINVKQVMSNLWEAMFAQHVTVLTDMLLVDLHVYLET